MDKSLTCVLCGGTNFTKEAGFYFCNECQTQSQDIREHVLQSAPDDVDLSKVKVAKRIRTVPKQEDQLTSWECYNYVIVGLVDELIELGANPNLKQTIRFLWFKYLRKMEVLNSDADALPKLGIFNSKMDADIVYGRRPVRRRFRSRTRSPSSPTTSSGSTPQNREKAKHKRSLIAAQYDEVSQTQASEDISLHNQSLSSLRSTPDGSTKGEKKFLQYNKPAKKELLKLMSKNHLKTHCRDVYSELNCHKVSYRSVPSTYTKGPYVLSRKKVYALIYLGLLINKDKIQLGDLLRFVREGNLSYHDVDHFFPEELKTRNLNLKTWNYGNEPLSHSNVREVTVKLAKYLGVIKYISLQNLLDLCQRYCHELNLPEEIWAYTLALLSRAVPKMQITGQSRWIPNYEGRIISMIMFVLKLFFGLDDVTEYAFSNTAETLNMQNVPTQTQSKEKKMFVWKDWAHYISYRKLVLIQHHFPTRCLYDDDSVHNLDLCLQFITDQNLKHDKVEPHVTKELDILKHLLTNLANKQEIPKEPLLFSANLTPFRNYINNVLDSVESNNCKYLTEVLHENFKNSSVAFLVNPFNYLEKLNNDRKVAIKHRGANKDLKLIETQNAKSKRTYWRYHVKDPVQIRLVNSSKRKRTDSSVDDSHKDRKEKFNHKEIIRNFERRNMKDYQRRIRKMITIKNNLNKDKSVMSLDGSFLQSQASHILNESTTAPSQPSTSTSVLSDQDFYYHYNPQERYWLNSYDVSGISQEDFSEFIRNFSSSFKLLLNECARITEQCTKDLFEEYNNVELYLSYIAKYSKKNVPTEKVVDKELLRMIAKAKRNW